MSVLEEYSSKLYSRLLYNYAVRKYLDQSIYLKEEHGKFIPVAWLSDHWSLCEAMANLIIDAQEMLKVDCGDLKNETEFFVAIAHIMFVPFGNCGYNFLKKIVSEKFKGKEIGEFLYKKFLSRSNCPLNGKLLKGLNKKQKEYIKDFFLNFDKKEEVLCSEPKDVATLVCRLYFALYGIETSSYPIRSLIDTYMVSIRKEISSAFDYLKVGEICKLNISDYASRIPEHKPLNYHEEQFILEKFELL